MDYFYEFCGVRFRVDTPLEMRIDRDASLFQTAPLSPDVTITVTPSDTLTPHGELLARRGEKQIWRDGSAIQRLTQDMFRSQPHLLCTYSLDAPQRVSCTARAANWEWATRSNFFWPGVSLPQLLLRFRALVFHASYVGTPQGAILFTAPSQTGKSTQAALWQTHRGAEVLNGDKAAVRLDGAPMVHGMPFSGTSGICRNVSMPLRCIVILSQAPENAVRRLGAAEALALLPQNLFADASIREEWQMTLSLLLDLISAAPVYALACTPDVRAVETLETTLVHDGF